MRSYQGVPNEAWDREMEGTGSRVLREFIKNPVFAELVKSNVASIDPERAKEVISTFLWADPYFSLSLLGTLPSLFNYIVEALVELARQLGNFPPELLGDFLSSLSREVDVRRLKELPAAWGSVADEAVKQNPELFEKLSRAAIKGMNASLRSVAALFDLVSAATPSPAASQVFLDGKVLGQALTSMARFVRVTVSNDDRFVVNVLQSVEWIEVFRALATCLFSALKAVAVLVIRKAKRTAIGFRNMGT